STAFAIVAINPYSFALTPTIDLQHFPVAVTLVPWMTSANVSLAAELAVTVTNSSFTYTLPPLSIVAFVGQATNNPPSLTPIANQTINAGVVLLLTNTDAQRRKGVGERRIGNGN